MKVLAFVLASSFLVFAPGCTITTDDRVQAPPTTSPPPVDTTTLIVSPKLRETLGDKTILAAQTAVDSHMRANPTAPSAVSVAAGMEAAKSEYAKAHSSSAQIPAKTQDQLQAALKDLVKRKSGAR